MEYTARELLSRLYHAAIDAVDGRFRVQQWCQQQPDYRPQYVIAIGKAAAAMLQGALDSCTTIESALLITLAGNVPRKLLRDKRVECVFSAHPIPDENSLQAGDALLRFIRRTPPDARLLFLISGGSSALVEVLREGVSLAQLQQLNQHLLASGQPIDQMNAERARLSRIKGGGLLAFTGERACTQLLISDVRGNDAAVIGSGLLSAPDCGVATHIIATLDHALDAARDAAQQFGIEVLRHPDFIAGEATAQGVALAQRLLALPAGVHLFGGETTVTLPDKPGIGGRNQTLALAMAPVLEGHDICVMCAGSDGIDGNTPCAGAVVTGDTAARARQMGFDIEQELARANAGAVLMATGDLFKPGPTQTNVMDFVFAYRR